MININELKQTIDANLARAREDIISQKHKSFIDPSFDRAAEALRKFELELAAPGYNGTHDAYLATQNGLLDTIYGWRASHLGNTLFTDEINGSMYNSSPSNSRAQSDARRTVARLAGIEIRPQESPEAVSVKFCERMRSIEAELSRQPYNPL